MNVTYNMGYEWRVNSSVYKMGYSAGTRVLLKDNAAFIQTRNARLALISGVVYILSLDDRRLGTLNIYSLDRQLLISHKFPFTLNTYDAAYGLLVIVNLNETQIYAMDDINITRRGTIGRWSSAVCIDQEYIICSDNEQLRIYTHAADTKWYRTSGFCGGLKMRDISGIISRKPGLYTLYVRGYPYDFEFIQTACCF
jgi:hypothetical protein